MKTPPAPFLVAPGKSIESLQRLPRVHEEFNEAFLQELLEHHPETLPAASLRDDVGSLVCVGREVGLGPAGVVDNLYLSTTGYPLVVETKLWRNPQARREVLSQTLDYIKELVTKSYDWFAEQSDVYCKERGLPRVDLIDRLSEAAADELDSGQVVDRVNRALQRGDVLAMIVGDGIESRLQQLVSHVCRDSVHLRYALALVEIACYRVPGCKGGRILAVPRIVQEVEPVERAYVRVELAESLEGKLVVTPKVDPEPLDGAGARRTLSEEEFFGSVERDAGRACRDAMERFYEDLTSSGRLSGALRASSLMLKIDDPAGEHPGASILALDRRGKIYNTWFLRGQLKRWGLDPKTVESIAADYWRELGKLDPRFKAKGIAHLAPRQFLPFEELKPLLGQIKKVTMRTVDRVEEEVGKLG